MTVSATRIGAFVGAAGGVGTTRLTVEAGALLASAGRDVALFDAAYATQGLAGYVPGRIDPDVTAMALDAATDDPDAVADPSALDAAVDLPWDLPGRAVAAPARAPFERLARAKSPAAARGLTALLAAASEAFDHVLVDVPPVAANQSVAAVAAADRLALVTRPTASGVDALQRARGRLADVGADPALVVANRAADCPPDADHAVPDGEADVTTPSVLDGAPPFAPAVADVTAALFDVDVADALDGGVVGTVRRRLER